jgi:hypothetical protein
MNASPSSPASTSASQGFDELLEQIAARLQAGQSVDLQSHIARYPQHAEQLRRLVPTMQALADFGSAGSGSATLAPDDGRPVGAALGDFPPAAVGAIC